MDILLFSRYGSKGASSRVRYLQYIAYFKSHNVRVSVCPLFSNRYIEAKYSGKKPWIEVFLGYLNRAVLLLTARRYDLVILEKELFPFLPAIAENILRLIGVRYIVDFDDAIFHQYDKHSNRLVKLLLRRKIERVMRYAKVVVVGNQYLADRAIVAGVSEVGVILTVVDTERYRPVQTRNRRESLTVGWMGTPKTSHYLFPLVPVFGYLKKRYYVRFIAIGVNSSEFSSTAVETADWSEETEVSSIQQFDIGIVPLIDSHWERGKCGYKLIQYMACGLPVIASPVGVNKDMVVPGVNGYLAKTNEEWMLGLESLITMDLEKRSSMGAAGRKLVVECYSLAVQAPRFLELMRQVAL